MEIDQNENWEKGLAIIGDLFLTISFKYKRYTLKYTNLMSIIQGIYIDIDIDIDR